MSLHKKLIATSNIDKIEKNIEFAQDFSHAKVNERICMSGLLDLESRLLEIVSILFL